MKVLIVKTSSLGDVIHTLPALTDAAAAIPGIRFDWVLEEGFAEIPAWHPQVDRVIPVAWRRWRKNLLGAWQAKALQHFFHALRSTMYDKIIDAQGLFKSAVMASLAKGLRAGLDVHSAREPLATLFYQQRYTVSRDQHAVARTRQLFSQALHYDIPIGAPDYGILPHFSSIPVFEEEQKRLLFFHGTTRKDKEWPMEYWVKLGQFCCEAGYVVALPWGNEEERQRAEQIAGSVTGVNVLPKLSLAGLAELLVRSRAVVAVDTGLGHLAAALNVPTLSLYGPTHPDKIGACGENQRHLCAPGEMGNGILADLLPEVVWRELEGWLVGSVSKMHS